MFQMMAINTICLCCNYYDCLKKAIIMIIQYVCSICKSFILICRNDDTEKIIWSDDA